MRIKTFPRCGRPTSDRDSSSSSKVCFCKNDSFVLRFAIAVARLPTVTRLSITDPVGFEQRPPSPELADPIYDPVRRRLLEPTSWVPGAVSIPLQRPVELLYQLPLAVVRAGNPLTELHICPSTTIDFRLILCEEQVGDPPFQRIRSRTNVTRNFKIRHKLKV